MRAATLSCAGCGAGLAFPEGRDRVVCPYCGRQSLLVPGTGSGEERPPTAPPVAGLPPELFEKALAAADADALRDLCASYVRNARAHVDGGQVEDASGARVPPDEALMRSIEETIDVVDEAKDEFRRKIANFVGALAIDGRSFEYRTYEPLHRALAACLYLRNAGE